MQHGGWAGGGVLRNLELKGEVSKSTGLGIVETKGCSSGS